MATRDSHESLIEFVENMMADHDFRGSHTWTGWGLHADGDIDRHTEGGGTWRTERERGSLL
ncbi:hypothetical protein ABVK25_000115 [Lepraria finkii]|uniref:Uncharacterized protein n=1 Tax=Lepraria finkii TaxID=1340010 RepID=A0ABR4BM00_9LECA